MRNLTEPIQKSRINRTKAIAGLLLLQNFCSILEQSCCKKRQKKGPGQETGLGNRGCLKILNDTKLVLSKHE